MNDINYIDLLPQLRFNLRENDCASGCICSAFSQSELLDLLEKHKGDINAASYEGLIIKAENDAVNLSDGLNIGSSREYWLNLARLYRPCKTHNMPRTDDEVIIREHK